MVPESSMFYKKISRHFLKVPAKLGGNLDWGSCKFDFQTLSSFVELSTSFVLNKYFFTSSILAL